MEDALVMPSQVQSAASLIERTVTRDDAYLESSVPAFCAFTDFRRDNPITVEADTSIDEALRDMKRLSTQALLVTSQELGNIEQQVVGLITYYDIERRQPHRYPQTAAPSEQNDIRVRDVMTQWNELPLIDYESLKSLTAQGLYTLFQGRGLTHLLVIETHGDEPALARGLVSRAILANRLRPPRTAIPR